MQTARSQMGVTILDRFLYVVGGSSHQEVLRTVERYSFDDDKWTTVSPMSISRASPAVTAADGLIYVAGGDQVILKVFLIIIRAIPETTFFDFSSQEK